MILLQYIHIKSHPSHLTVRDQDTVSISPHSIPSYTPTCPRQWYCSNISTFNPILHTYLSETMILFQYLHIQPHPSHLAVKDKDTASIYQYSIPSYTPTYQRPGYSSISQHSIPSYTHICQRPGYCFNISTFNHILHIYHSETMTLLQFFQIQSHPTDLFLRHQDTVSISLHSTPSYTPIRQRPGYCFNISTFNPILHTYHSEAMILRQHLHIQSHPSHLTVRDLDTAPISSHPIPSFTPNCQRPWYCFNISTFNPILHTYLSETMILFQFLHIQPHPSHLAVRDQDTASISPHSIPSYSPICQRTGYCFNISTFNPILHTYLSEPQILFQYIHSQSHPKHRCVRDHDTASLSPHSIPSYTPICQRPGNWFNISTFNPTLRSSQQCEIKILSPHSISHYTIVSASSWYCSNISTFNPILHTYMSESRILLRYLHIQLSYTPICQIPMILLQYLHIQSHPTHLSVRDHDTVSISPYSIPSYTPIGQRPGYCFKNSTFNPILHTYLSETMILLQYLHIQTHPTHISVRNHDTASISPYSIPSITSICQRPGYCLNISTFNPILHTFLSETMIPFQYLHIQSNPTHLSVRDQDTASISPHSISSYTPICQRPGCCFHISTFYPILLTYLPKTRILFQHLHIQSHPSHLTVREHDTAPISSHPIPSFTPNCQRQGYFLNISTFNPILHTYLSETRILLKYLHIQSHPTHPSVRDKDTVSISPHSIPSITPICQTPWYCFNISTCKPNLHTYLSETMILFQYLHIQSHPTHLSVRDHDTVSISTHLIPSYTPICQRPGYCFIVYIFNPILLAFLSETWILLQYLHIQSHPTHLSVRDLDTVSISPHSIPSYTPLCQRPGYCFNISTFNPIRHTYLSETMILFQYLHI